jgi:hypothetical protein
LLTEEAVTADEASACPSSTIVFSDGSIHAQIHFLQVGEDFVSSDANCLIGALGPKQAAMVKFLTEHFSDIAVGMVTDGTVDDIKHEGLRAFVHRVSLGEIKISRQPPA